MRSADYRVEIVDPSSLADVSVLVVNSVVVDLTGAVPGEVLTIQPDGSIEPDPVGGGVAVTIEDEGTPLGTFTTIDFVGAGVTASLVGAAATVTIPGGGGAASVIDDARYRMLVAV